MSYDHPTRQDIFDCVWGAFVIQNKPPGCTEHGHLRYLTEDGCRCAIGVLADTWIPGARTACVRFNDALHDFSDWPWPTSYWDIDRFLADIQHAHDTSVPYAPSFAAANAHQHPFRTLFHARIGARLRALAARYCLDCPEPCS